MVVCLFACFVFVAMITSPPPSLSLLLVLIFNGDEDSKNCRHFCTALLNMHWNTLIHNINLKNSQATYNFICILS